MTPTIVLDARGRVVLVAGAAGGPRIITTTLDIVRAVVEFHQDVAAAVAMPRVHMQYLPDLVDVDPGAFAPQTLAALRAMGYRIDVDHVGSIANAIAIDARGIRTAAREPRLATGLATAY
jgi:gamma-glutamyltranspeptidase/glutathione hydrolase